ncbi:MAG: hypothetical protein K6F82_00635 [Sphaerochaetaceae bacterium]|nr:hypothetical protein [Sphaerochaetaceae bacterium]
MAEIESDAEEFLKKLEEKHGGKIDRRNFSLWYGDSEGNIREAGVFVYRINGIYHYEDFKRRASILGFTVSSKKNEKYVKFERSFNSQDIVGVETVRKSAARAFIEKGKEAKEASAFSRVFLETVTKIQLKDGTVRFFQLVDKDFFN